MATSPRPEPHEILAGVAKRFAAILATLVAAPATRRTGAAAATHSIIRHHAAKPWTLEIDRQSREFSIRTAGTKIVLGEPMFGGMLRSVLDQLDSVDDGLTAAIYAKLGDPADRHDRVVDLVMALFLAHEFLHIEQRLGSDQYRDSDAYPDAVGAVDYQADVAALSYVATLVPPVAALNPHELLTLLTTLHVFTMNAFADPMGRDTFDRLLVWHFHAARIARASTVPDMLHPAIQQRPTVSLPQFRAINGDALTEADFAARRNDTSGSRLDLVLAAADGAGVLKLFRLAATDGDRVRRLAMAIIGKRLGEVRQELEEFFLSHAASMEFTRPDRNLTALQGAVAAGNALLPDDTVLLSLDQPAVCAYLDRVEFLLAALPRHVVDPKLGDYRANWSVGWRSDIEKTIGTASLGKRNKAEKARARASALTSEVRRIAIRLSSILDAMMDDGV